MKGSRLHRSLDFVWRQRGWMGKAITLSIAIHLALLIISGSIVILRAFTKPQAQFTSEPPTRPKLEPRKLEMKVKAQDLQKRSARPRLTPRLLAQAPTALALPQIKIDPNAVKRKAQREFARLGISGYGKGIGGGFGDGDGGGMGGGLMKLPEMLRARCDKKARVDKLLESGGSAECEAAVLKSLQWLKQRQNPDGSWGSAFPGAMTGLALLAFLGHCETPESPQFGPTVRKAINYLLTNGEAAGGQLSCRGGSVEYQHGIATYALAEAYSLTQMARIAPVLEKAAQIIIKGQTPAGGWMYKYAGATTDMSVTGWQFQALKAAHLSGLKVDGLEACLDKAVENLKKLQAADGSFPYQPDHVSGYDTRGVTGAGVLGLQMWKPTTTKEINNGLEFIQQRKDLKYDANGCHLYAWYYATLANFMKGGSKWTHWNKLFRNELLKNQAADGSFNPEGGGSSLTDGMGQGDGPVYRASLCTLMLEVYYRFLPATR